MLATIEFLAVSGLNPTITSLQCGHSFLSASGNVSEHSSGNAVDIAAVNGTPIVGHQGAGTITETTIRKLLTLQGPMQPHQIISLMDLGGPTMVLADHADHIHVGFKPLFGVNAKLGGAARKVLSNNQWDKFLTRLTEIQNPVVRTARRSTRSRSGTHAAASATDAAPPRPGRSSTGSASSTSPSRRGLRRGAI